MDELSWRRWQEFSERMARTCFADSKDPDLAFILGELDHFFGCCGKWEIAAFASWDNSDSYPRESGYFARDRRCRCWWRHGGPRPNRNGQDPDCEICGGDPDWLPMATGSYPCDMVLEQESESLPFWECENCQHHHRTGITERFTARRAGLSEAQAIAYGEWRSAPRPWWRCSCDEDRYAWEESWIEQWFGPVRCCLRDTAGIESSRARAKSGSILIAPSSREYWLWR